MAGILTIFSLTSANDDREVCLDLTSYRKRFSFVIPALSRDPVPRPGWEQSLEQPSRIPCLHCASPGMPMAKSIIWHESFLPKLTGMWSVYWVGGTCAFVSSTPEDLSVEVFFSIGFGLININ